MLHRPDVGHLARRRRRCAGRFLSARRAVRVLATRASAVRRESLRAELLALNTPAAPTRLHRAALAAQRAWPAIYADGRRAAACATRAARRRDVAAIGAHGQTVRHRPRRVRRHRLHAAAEQPGPAGRTDAASTWWPISAAATWLPAARARRWCRPFTARCSARGGPPTAVLNLGGISNLSLLPAGDGPARLGFDCGPGNALMDHWCQQPPGRPSTPRGAWAASGTVDAGAAARRCWPSPTSRSRRPRAPVATCSTAGWLDVAICGAMRPTPAAADVQATLAELTAQTCAAAVSQRHRAAMPAS